MKLKKDLNLIDVFSITTGTMMSAGLFILPGLAFEISGPSIILAYFLAGLMTIPGMLSQAELSTAMPKAGGSYYFITRSMGPAVGTVYGLITWLALTFKSSFALIGITIFVTVLIPFNEHAIAAALCIAFLIINFIGIKVAGRAQIILVISILVMLLIYVILGLPETRVQNFNPFISHGMMAVLSATGFVFISYGGLLKVASIAEEVKNPGRSLPLGMILSILVVGIFYVLVIFVTVGILGSIRLEGSLTPVSDGADAFLGLTGKIVLSIVAILAFTSAANAGIMAASRYPMALGRDELLPKSLGKISKRFQTPHISIIVTGVFILGTLFLRLEILVKVASSVVILTYLFSCIAIIILRESRLQNYQPSFKAPLYPWIQIIGIVGFTFFLFEIGREVFFIICILIPCGIVIYLIFGRVKAKKEYALMHLIERITTKELTSHSLETELKEVIRERDDIIKDRFDSIIEDSIVMDIEESISVEEFFRSASSQMYQRLSIKQEILAQKLLEREQESSTVLTGTMAIPHIIVEGEKIFDILVARCKEGVVFSESERDVHAIFILVGTRDERNFHLRALSAIAQIVQDPNFEEKWLKAKSTDALRDIMLLGKRRR